MCWRVLAECADVLTWSRWSGRLCLLAMLNKPSRYFFASTTIPARANLLPLTTDRSSLIKLLWLTCGVTRGGWRVTLDKCKYMHFKCMLIHCNPCRTYCIKGHALATTSTERDLGIIISPSMKHHEQVRVRSSHLYLAQRIDINDRKQ